MAEGTADFGLIGLAVMGQNLVLNINDHGFTVVVFNRTVSKVDAFLEGEAKGTNVVGAHSIEELCSKLKRPRRVMLLVKAGSAVDDFIHALFPHLEKGDIIIDGGNSYYRDSMRRAKYVEEAGFLFIGTGVSGGEEGARHGPSLMPGGSPAAWPHVKPIFQAIAAVSDGEPCCDWVGQNGAGHYVKMVHNGIEYGDMQLISEAYSLMRGVLGMSNAECAEVFKRWNKGVLDSYLIEITGHILSFKENSEELIDKILDAAGQKGTGKWTAQSALDFGIPVTLIGEAVFARALSSMKDERVQSSKLLSGPPKQDFTGDREQFIDAIENALYASKIISYAQGYMLLREAAVVYDWELNYGGIALMWRGGCIIRSKFLGDIRSAYLNNKDLVNLLHDKFFTNAISKAQAGWRTVVGEAARFGCPTPAFMTALAFYDGYRSARLPANLLQAQRDYFGAHTYERVDRERKQYFHTNWTGTGGNVSASTYEV